MNTTFKVKEQYKTLDDLGKYLGSKSKYECKKMFNSWRDISITKEYCVLVKKSALYGIKVNFVDDNHVMLEPVVPGVYLRSFVTGRGFIPPIVRALLAKGQRQLFNEVSKYFAEIYN